MQSSMEYCIASYPGACLELWNKSEGAVLHYSPSPDASLLQGSAIGKLVPAGELPQGHLIWRLVRISLRLAAKREG